MDKWLDAIEKEIESRRGAIQEYGGLETLYIGGGTPSLLEADQFQRLVGPLLPYLQKDAEFSVECNPESLDRRKIQMYKRMGVNRISLGVQSFHEQIVHSIGRKHTTQQVFQVLAWLKEAGIVNISIDLMYALPNQSMEQIQEDLNLFFKCDLPHLSIYSLILEENSIMAKKGIRSIDEDIEADQYEMIVEQLKNHGYTHYEISSFARDEMYSQHNLAYWKDKDFIGIGCGAYGREKGKRYRHTDSIYTYIDNCLTLYQEESDPAFEALMMALRTCFGLDLAAYRHKYGIDLETAAASILKQFPEDLLIKDGCLIATEKGREKLNTILIEFLDLFE